MSRVVFLLEERSMKVLLDALLPRLVPGLPFLCVPHEGKQDLEKSIPRKLRAWREPGVRFVVVRDNDKGDCRELKSRLARLRAESGRSDTVVRIACQELESWYLGQPEALSAAFEDEALVDVCRRARFRDPDGVVGAAAALATIVPSFQKTSGARAIAGHLTAESQSRSYLVFLDACRRLAAGLPSARPS